MLKIFKDVFQASFIFQTPQYKNIYVISRSFSRKRRPTPNEEEIEKMSELVTMI